MKFLADENVEKPIVTMLRDNNHDVLYISELIKRSIDEQLLKQANAESRILLTNDKDFGELVYKSGVSKCQSSECFLSGRNLINDLTGFLNRKYSNISRPFTSLYII